MRDDLTANKDRIRLEHMLSYALEAVQFAEGFNIETLEADLKTVRAIAMSIGTIGEAAAVISQALRDEHPDVEWAQIKGMRNNLFHRYFEIDVDVLYNTVTNDLPPLIAKLRLILDD